MNVGPEPLPAIGAQLDLIWVDRLGFLGLHAGHLTPKREARRDDSRLAYRYPGWCQPKPESETMSEPEYVPLRDIDVGVMDALMTIMEIFLTLGISPEHLATPLQAQRDGQLAAGRPDAAAVLANLLSYVSDPDLARRRKIVQIFQREPPKGTA
jgi:hypothetical protein